MVLIFVTSVNNNVSQSRTNRTFSGDVLYCYESICSHGYPTNTGAHIRGMSRGIEILSHT